MVFIPIFGIEFLKPFGFPKLRGGGEPKGVLYYVN